MVDLRETLAGGFGALCCAYSGNPFDVGRLFCSLVLSFDILLQSRCDSKHKIQPLQQKLFTKGLSIVLRKLLRKRGY
jgi:hypothetical protein